MFKLSSTDLAKRMREKNVINIEEKKKKEIEQHKSAIMSYFLWVSVFFNIL